MAKNRKEYLDHYHNEHNVKAVKNAEFIARLPKQAIELVITCPCCNAKRLVGKTLPGVGLLQQSCEVCRQNNIKKGKEHTERYSKNT